MRRRIAFAVGAVLCGAAVAPAAARDLATCYDYQRSRTAIEACTYLMQSVSDRLQLADIHSARGVAYRWSGDPGKSIPDFDEAIRLDPRHSIAYGQRGISYRQLGNVAQALADLQTAVALDATNQTAANVLRDLQLRGR